MKPRTTLLFLAPLALALLVPVSGCQKKPRASTPAPTPSGQGLQPKDFNPGIAKHLPSTGRVNPSNDLRQIALFYQAQEITGQPPKSLADLPDLRRDMPQVAKAIDDGIYVINWGVRGTSGRSNTILAYVRDAPTAGGVVVLLDGSVHNMTPAEFQKYAGK
jgi:hypothetical protein